MLRLPDCWLWDFWLADDGAAHHCFFLKASRALGNPDRRHHHAVVGHATSPDLVNWREVADALSRGPGEGADVPHRHRAADPGPRPAHQLGGLRGPGDVDEGNRGAAGGRPAVVRGARLRLRVLAVAGPVGVPGRRRRVRWGAVGPDAGRLGGRSPGGARPHARGRSWESMSSSSANSSARRRLGPVGPPGPSTRSRRARTAMPTGTAAAKNHHWNA